MDKYKKDILKNIVIFKILSMSIFLLPNVKAEDKKKINSINYGLSEKGIYFGVDRKVNPKIFWSFGLNYLDYIPGYFDAGFSEKIPVDVFIRGVNFSASKYLNKKEKFNWNLFLNSEIGLNSLIAVSNVDLSRLYYDLGDIKIKCSSCGELRISTNSFTLIPKLSLGIEKYINDRFNLRALVGIQYISINDVEWDHKSNYPLPNFVKNEINSAITNINSELDTFSNFQPSASILIIYKF